MVGEFGETVVLDWGLAKHLGHEDIHAADIQETLRAISLSGDSSPKTAYGQVMGTPSYMSPEQAKGDIESINAQSDIYSLGAILFELLSGEAPFIGQAIPHILYQVINEPLRRIRAIEPHAPRELIAICERAMAKKPEERYISAKQLAEEIERFQSGEMVQSYKYTVTERTTRYINRHKSFLGIIAVALLFLTTASTFYVQNIVSTNAKLTQVNLSLRQANTGLRVARIQEDLQRKEIEHRIYTSSIILAGKYLEDHANPVSLRLLMNSPEIWRNWEWGYLYGQNYNHVITTLVGHKDTIWGASFSPDGSRVVTASWDATAKVWDAASGAELFTLAGHLKHRVSSAHFSPDGKRIVTASWDNTAKIWDADSSKKLLTLIGHSGSLGAASFSPDGSRIVTASDDRTAKVWDSTTGKELLTLKGHSAPLSSAVFSPNGKSIATASEDKTAKVWDANSGKELLTLKGHSGPVESACFSPDGMRIVTASWDKTAKIWDATSGKELFTFVGHKSRVNSASFSPDGKQIATASFDRATKVWDSFSGKELLTLAVDPNAAYSVSFSPDGNRVVTTGYTAIVWDISVGTELLVLVGHGDETTDASLSPDGKSLVTASDDKTAKVWDIKTCKELLTLKGHTDGLNTARFSPEGSKIVTASQDNQAKIWDATSGIELCTLAGHRESINHASFSLDGRLIVTSSDDDTAKIWDVVSGRELLTLKGQSSNVHEASFSLDGKRIVTASEDGTAKVWSIPLGDELFTIKGHGLGLQGVSFSPDGRRIVTTSWDSTARVWDANSGAELLTLSGHNASVVSASFNPDNSRIVTASGDGTAKIWDADSGEELVTLAGHNDDLNNAFFSPDGKSIVTVSRDRTIRVWDTVPWRPDAWMDDKDRNAVIIAAKRKYPTISAYKGYCDDENNRRLIRELEDFFDAKTVNNRTPYAENIECQGIQFNTDFKLNAVPGLIFSKDEILIRINCINAPTIEDVHIYLEEMGRSLGSDSSENHQIVFEMLNRYAHRVILLEFPVRDSKQMYFPKQLALVMLEEFVHVLEQHREDITDFNRTEATSHGMILPDHDFNGIWLSLNEAMPQDILAFVDQMGLKDEDYIAAVNGLPIYDMNTLIMMANGWLEGVKASDSYTIKWDVKRGLFECLTINVLIE